MGRTWHSHEKNFIYIFKFFSPSLIARVASEQWISPRDAFDELLWKKETYAATRKLSCSRHLFSLSLVYCRVIVFPQLSVISCIRPLLFSSRNFRFPKIVLWFFTILRNVATRRVFVTCTPADFRGFVTSACPFFSFGLRETAKTILNRVAVRDIGSTSVRPLFSDSRVPNIVMHSFADYRIVGACRVKIVEIYARPQHPRTNRSSGANLTLNNIINNNNFSSASFELWVYFPSRPTRLQPRPRYTFTCTYAYKMCRCMWLRMRACVRVYYIFIDF